MAHKMPDVRTFLFNLLAHDPDHTGPASDADVDDYEWDPEGGYPFIEIDGMLDLQHLANEIIQYFEEEG